jgi:DNA-binding response OmpR family regulator
MPAPPRRILLLEDDYLIAGLIAGVLDELGYGVLGPAHRLDEAMKFATEETFDGALLDWGVDAGGSGAVADILIERGIPFVFVTAHKEIGDGQYRDIPIVSKPFSMESLGSALEKALRRG